MRTPALLACLAVAAASASSKDPLEVSRTWALNAAEAAEPLTGSLDLRGLSPWPAKPHADSMLPGKPPEWGQPKLREPLLDAPSYRIPKVLPDNAPMPRHAKPWRYGDQQYWLLPLIPSDEKK